ncbi:hypothetical protein F2Q69_00047047 [Brassica cretica]|uniref:Uncharacterized protein n=1 Tax=Brassica cretica TaxID=69181 RepID=A0A8S9PUE2_BRACR|nr:hypothetical protein F2Q69_00047047 [Brassica cretica]
MLLSIIAKVSLFAFLSDAVKEKSHRIQTARDAREAVDEHVQHVVSQPAAPMIDQDALRHMVHDAARHAVHEAVQQIAHDRLLQFNRVNSIRKFPLRRFQEFFRLPHRH